MPVWGTECVWRIHRARLGIQRYEMLKQDKESRHDFTRLIDVTLLIIEEN